MPFFFQTEEEDMWREEEEKLYMSAECHLSSHHWFVTYTHGCNRAFCVLNLPEGISAHKEEGGESAGLLAEEALGI